VAKLSNLKQLFGVTLTGVTVLLIKYSSFSKNIA
jgi:hypothetical protein